MALPTKATHQQTRVHNERLVVRTLYDLGPISRAEVARLTGLTRTTVSDVVAVAPRRRRRARDRPRPVERRQGADPPRGRPRRASRRRARPRRGALRRLPRQPPRRDPPDGRAAGRRAATATRPSQLVFDLLDQLLDGITAPLLGIGIGTPGLVDSRTGTIRRAVNLDWRDLPLGEIVGERYGVPVNVANDSQAAALAEYTYAGEGRVPNLIAIRVGRGVGAGLILRGALFQGDGSGAGEIGHIVVDDDGALCRCGRTGCLETVAGMRAIETRASDVDRIARTDLARSAGRSTPARPGRSRSRRCRRCARPGDRGPDRRARRRSGSSSSVRSRSSATPGWPPSVARPAVGPWLCSPTASTSLSAGRRPTS